MKCILFGHSWDHTYEIPGGYDVEDGGRMEGLMTFDLCSRCGAARCVVASMSRVREPSDAGGES